jgi:hypothetical protein
MSTINAIDGGVRITGIDNSRNPFKLAGPGKDPDYLLNIDHYLEKLLDEHQITVVLGDKKFEPGEGKEVKQKEIKKALEPLTEEKRKTISRIINDLCWLLKVTGVFLAEDSPYDIEKVITALKGKEINVDFDKISAYNGSSWDTTVAWLVELGIFSADEIAKDTAVETSTKGVVASDEGAPVVEETESIPPAASVETSPNYTVKKGDTLWAIAERELGDGNRWREIYDANENLIDSTAYKRFKGQKTSGLEEKNGQTIVWIFEGQNLIIPQVEVGVTGEEDSDAGDSVGEDDDVEATQKDSDTNEEIVLDEDPREGSEIQRDAINPPVNSESAREDSSLSSEDDLEYGADPDSMATFSPADSTATDSL